MTNRQKADEEYEEAIKAHRAKVSSVLREISDATPSSVTAYACSFPTRRKAPGPIPSPLHWVAGLNDALVLEDGNYQAPTGIRFEFFGKAPREYVRELLLRHLNDRELIISDMEHQRQWEEAEYVEGSWDS